MFDDATIAHIGTGLIAVTLPKSEWTHAAHVAAAAHIIAARPDLAAHTAIPGLIRRYNQACGVINSAAEGYHHTITLASIAAVRAGLALAPAGTLAARTNWLLAGMLGDKHWPERFWQHDTLFSPAARLGWTAPDRAPLTFAVGV